jgi:uncharacterized membrane protein YkoI
MTIRPVCAAALLAVALPSAVFAWTGEKYASQAKLTMEQATAIALRERPGTVTDRELEREHGGLRYSFDIKGADGALYEVGVDAKSGKVLEDSKEGPHPD